MARASGAVKARGRGFFGAGAGDEGDGGVFDGVAFVEVAVEGGEGGEFFGAGGVAGAVLLLPGEPGADVRRAQFGEGGFGGFLAVVAG